MEEALIARLRGAVSLVALLGVFGARPAIDMIERQSDEFAAFPAISVQKISPGRDYTQDRASALERPRIRFEVYGLSYGTTRIAARGLIAELEQANITAGIRFHRGQLQFDRDFPPENIGGNAQIFRIILDFFLAFTPET
jgi:hypothetical protein